MSGPLSTAVEADGRRDRLVTDTLIYLAGRSVPAVLTIVSVPLFVRALGAEAYGLYALFAALALTAGNTAGAWIGQAVLRFASRLQQWGGRSLEGALNRALVIVVPVAAAVTAVGCLFMPWSLPLWAAAIVTAGSMAAYALAAARHQAALRAGRASLAGVVRVGVGVGLPALAIFVFDVRDPVVLLVGAASGNVAGMTFLSVGLPSLRRPGWRARVALGRMLTFGAPLAGWMLISMLLNLSDRYVIGALLGTAEVGSYAAVYDLVYKGVVFLFTPMLMAAHPMIMDAWNGGRKGEVRHLLRRTMTYAVAAGVSATALVWFLAPVVLPMVLGEAATSDSLRVAGPVAAGAFLWQVAMLAHKPLEIQQRTGTMLWFVALALVANVAVNIALIPPFGLVIAGYSTLLSALVYLMAVSVVAFRSPPASRA